MRGDRASDKIVFIEGEEGGEGGDVVKIARAIEDVVLKFIS